MDEAKNILLLYKEKDREIKQLQLKILELENSLTPKINNDIAPPAGSNTASPTEAHAIKLVTLKNKLNKKIIYGEILRNSICDLIEKINDPISAELLYSRYMLLLPWQQVSERVEKCRAGGKEYSIKSLIGYSHKRALEKFQTILNTTPDKRKDEIYDLARNY